MVFRFFKGKFCADSILSKCNRRAIAILKISCAVFALDNNNAPEAKTELNDMHVDKCSFHRFTAAIDCLRAWAECFQFSIKKAKWRNNSVNYFNCFIVSFRCTTLFKTFFLSKERIAHILPWSGFIHGTTHNVASAHKMRASLSIHIIAWVRKRCKSYLYCWLTRSLVQQNHYSILIYRR